MDARVLVAYSSRLGSTAQVAHVIGGAFTARGIDVDVLPARQVTSLEPYGFVVLGSAIYGGHWRTEAMRLLRRNRTELADRQVWLFQIGPSVLHGGHWTDPTPPAVRELAGAAVGPVTFPARLARSDARHWLMPHQDGPPAHPGPGTQNGDATERRDWDRVRRWAAEVALQVDVARGASATDRIGGLR